MHRREMCRASETLHVSSHAAKIHSTRSGEKTESNPDKKTPNNHAHPNPDPFLASRLDVGVVGDGDNGLGDVALGGDEVTLTGADSLALQVDVNTLLLGLALLDGVLLDTVDELLTGAGVLDVLDADVDALLEVAVVDALVQEDTDGGLGDVVDNAGLAVVDLVGHTVLTVNISCSISFADCRLCSWGVLGGSRIFEYVAGRAGRKEKFGLY
jgi:hypothetical protein